MMQNLLTENSGNTSNDFTISENERGMLMLVKINENSITSATNVMVDLKTDSDYISINRLTNYQMVLTLNPGTYRVRRMGGKAGVAYELISGGSPSAPGGTTTTGLTNAQFVNGISNLLTDDEFNAGISTLLDKQPSLVNGKMPVDISGTVTLSEPAVPANVATSTLQSALNTISDGIKTNTADISSKVATSALQTALNSIATGISTNTAGTNTALGTVNTALNTLNGASNSTNNNIVLLSDKVSTSALQLTLNTISEGIKTGVTSISDKVSTSALQASLNTISDGIRTGVNDISSKVSTAALQTSGNSISDGIRTNTNNILTLTGVSFTANAPNRIEGAVGLPSANLKGALRVMLTDSSGSPSSQLSTVNAPTSDAVVAIQPDASITLSTSKVLKATGGNLYGINICTTNTAGYLLIVDSSTVPVSGSAVLPKKCIPIPVNAGLDQSWHTPIRFNDGIVLLFSTTGPFIYTASSTAFLEGEAK